MSMRASYTVENVLHYRIPVSNHLLNKAFKLLRYLTGSNLMRGVLLMINL